MSDELHPYKIGDELVLVDFNRHPRLGGLSIGKVVEVVRILNPTRFSVGNVILKYKDTGEVLRGNGGQPTQWRVAGGMNGVSAEEMLVEIGAGDRSRTTRRLTPRLREEAARQGRLRERFELLRQAHERLGKLLQIVSTEALDNNFVVPHIDAVVLGIDEIAHYNAKGSERKQAND